LNHDQTDILAAMRLAGAHVITRAEAQSMSDWFDAHEAERDALPWALRGGDACRVWVKGLINDATGNEGSVGVARGRSDQRDILPGSHKAGEHAPTARQLPQGTALVPILRKMFAAQRHAVLAKLQGKSIGDVDDEYFDRAVAAGAPDYETFDETTHRRYPDESGMVRDLDKMLAWKRAMTARHKADPDKAKLPQSFIPLDEWTPELAKEVKPVIEIIARAEGRALLTRVGASPDVFSVFEKNIPQAAENLSLKFAESTNATTSMQLDEALSKLRDEISSGLTEGDTRVELTKRVEEVFDQAESGRAETIARTEGSRAAHEGELMSAKESGVVRQKYLILSADACPICEAVAAEGPKDLDEPFRVDGDGPYGVSMTPPLHVNCQCSEGFTVTDAPEEKSMEAHDASAAHAESGSAATAVEHAADAEVDSDDVRPVPQDAPGAGAVLPDVRGGAADPGVKP
jgi:hypothetical protein